MPPDYCAHPLGIASVVGTPTSLTLHLDDRISSRRYSFPEHCLARLLPAVPRSGIAGEPSGILGLRMRGIKGRDVVDTVFGEQLPGGGGDAVELELLVALATAGRRGTFGPPSVTFDPPSGESFMSRISYEQSR